MASLRETKDRIASVRSTLKITSAMKLVASAKLRKAQQAVEAMRPYQKEQARMLAEVLAAGGRGIAAPSAESSDESMENGGKVAVVAVSSNSSLCGGFNANVIRKTLSVLDVIGSDVDIYPVGKRMADRLRKEGFKLMGNFDSLVGTPDYGAASEFAQNLIDAYNSGTYSKVILVYNHFVSTSRQQVVEETWLPFSLEAGQTLTGVPEGEEEYILEPSAKAIAEALLPQVMRLKIFTMLLDSVASEHAARTVAMQAATDNAEDLLSDLTLEYNKGRQSKITSEILDLAGGQRQ